MALNTENVEFFTKNLSHLEVKIIEFHLPYILWNSTSYYEIPQLSVH